MGFSIDLNSDVKKKSFYQSLLNVSQQTILDIGSGWGDLTLQLLNNNNIVIANDIEAAQLLGIYGQAEAQNLLNHLYLSNKPFPTGFQHVTDNSFDTIVLHRFLSVLKPDQVENAIQTSFRLLKPGGTLYIVSLSDQHHLYQGNIAKYPERIISSTHGINLFLAKQGLPLQAYTLPETVIALSEDQFLHYLKKSGFQIVLVEYPGTTQKTGVPEELPLRKGKENIAIIARKPLQES